MIGRQVGIPSHHFQRFPSAQLLEYLWGCRVSPTAFLAFKLQKLDAQVSYGYVLLQRKYSKEISYQDPGRIGQIDWVLNVRNKCTTADWLSKADSLRINYIKTKVSDSYPSYPEEEND